MLSRIRKQDPQGIRMVLQVPRTLTCDSLETTLEQPNLDQSLWADSEACDYFKVIGELEHGKESADTLLCL